MTQRRYDLDSLRIFAFGLLIFYHVGMFYVSWGWHVKSVHAGPAAEALMRLLNPWRLPLLFLISGAALRFAMDKSESLKQFTWVRTGRLLCPLLFGMFIMVMPQAWLQLVENGEFTGGVIDFYPGYLRNEYSITTPTWNHLWYVAYILVYTLMLAPISRLLSRFSEKVEGSLERLFSGRLGVLILITAIFLPHAVIRLTLDPYFPTTHDLTGDWANHAHSFLWLLTGYVIAKSSAVWATLQRGRWILLGLVSVLAIVLTLTWNNWDAIAEVETWLFPARMGRVLYFTAMILCLLAWAQAIVSVKWRGLTYLTEAIFPYYILHQTIIVMAGFWLTRQGLNVWTEFAAVMAATILGCGIGHEIIRRIKWLRPLFGLKPISKGRRKKSHYQ
ncbi:MAG: acyltransferase family protein [Litorimonas sp.]